MASNKYQLKLVCVCDRVTSDDWCFVPDTQCQIVWKIIYISCAHINYTPTWSWTDVWDEITDVLNNRQSGIRIQLVSLYTHMQTHGKHVIEPLCSFGCRCTGAFFGNHIRARHILSSVWRIPFTTCFNSQKQSDSHYCIVVAAAQST